MDKFMENKGKVRLKKEQKAFLNSWQIVKLQWVVQALANLFFGLPLAMITLLYIGYPFSAIKGIVFLYIGIYLFIFFPFYGLFPLFLLRSARKTLNKIYKKEKVEEKEGWQAIEGLLNLPGKLSFIIFVTVFSGFALGVFILWLGLIPELMPLIKFIVIIGLSIGFVVSIIHAFLNYIFLENYFRPVIEFLGFLYPGAVQSIKIRKTPLFLKVFLLVLLTTIASQISLWGLFLARIAATSPGELKTTFMYGSIVVGLTLAYIFVIAVLFSRNLTYPLKKLILWAKKVVEGEAKEKISIITNDEISEVVECLKQMVEELENMKAVLEIKVRARTEELRELVENREEEITKRTKELRERTEELEEFNKVAVGRELKMIELKKEIKELEEKLKKGRE